MNINSNDVGPFAPVVVSVYNRPIHLRQCVESLAANPESASTELFVLSDAAGRPGDAAAVASVREYCAKIHGFRRVHIVARPQNLGSFQNVKQIFDLLLPVHGRVIFLEDDNVVSRGFLAFMNQGLRVYEPDDRIFSVVGYNFPVAMPPGYTNPVYCYPAYSAYAVGIWHRKFREVDWSVAHLDHCLRNRRWVRDMDYWNTRCLIMARYAAARNLFWGDVFVSAHMIERDLYSIFPRFTRVRNSGMDGTGEHGGVDMRFSRQDIDESPVGRLDPAVPLDPDVTRVLRRYFGLPFRYRVRYEIGRCVRVFLPARRPILRDGRG